MYMENQNDHAPFNSLPISEKQELYHFFKKLVQHLETDIDHSEESQPQPSDPTETAQGFVAGLHPGDPLQLLFEDECEDFLPCFGEDESIQELPGIRVLMSFDAHDVLTIGEIRLLFGPALFYNVDEEGELLPLSLKELYQIKIFMQYLTVSVDFAGQETFAILLC